MKLTDYQIAEQSHQLLEGLGDDALGFLTAVERHLAIVAAPEVSWGMRSVDTGLLRALSGGRRDFFVVEHVKFKEYRVLIAARAYGTVLMASWLLVGSPRLSNDLARAIRSVVGAGGLHGVGSDLTALEILDLHAFVSITRLCFRKAIAELTSDDSERVDIDSASDAE